MNRRDFIASAAAVAATSPLRGLAQAAQPVHGFPPSVLRPDDYVETTPIAEYHNAPATAYEAFQDMKFGIRIHWGIYSIWHRGAESWPYLPMSFEDRQTYNSLYKTWNPGGFDADLWMNDFRESGLKMFAFTTKHHEGFSMFDTRTRVKSRANWTAPGGPRIEACDLAYSIMETPFRRDIVKELCDAAHKRDIKIDLYFSHPDWYDADFRPYVTHPFQIPSSAQWMTPIDVKFTAARLGSHAVIVPDPTDAEVKRMMERHRAQLLELLTNYGQIDMMCLDMWLGPRVWPELRKTLLMMRELQPDVMLRNRGIGNYGDYYTPERVVPGSQESFRQALVHHLSAGHRLLLRPRRGQIQRHSVDRPQPRRFSRQGRRIHDRRWPQRPRRVSSGGHPADERRRRVAQGERRSNLRHASARRHALVGRYDGALHANKRPQACLRNSYRLARRGGHAEDRAPERWFARHAAWLEGRTAMEVRFGGRHNDCAA